MKVLLTNDDGIYSIGIQTMAKRLFDCGHDILLVAPDRERSNCGHAMTLDRPVHLVRADKRFLLADFSAYKCDGFPTDCVTMGIDVLNFGPDLVISGINQGPNLGDDVTYSGTACAAMEGIISDVPSIAVSLVTHSRDIEFHNDTAADAVMTFLGWLGDGNPIPDGVFFNINVPNIPSAEIKGMCMARMGTRRYKDKVMTVQSPSGSNAYWIGGTIKD
ncbi:MAG: 5'/3'-nucleotidase SurE, partial [Synergistaceae bacterium]|nr:5'/3'-nucleotidase SurE [Synergistaceae bacterium]